MGYEIFDVNGRTLHLDAYLKRKLDSVKKIQKRNWDCVFIIDGVERSGKSTLGFVCGWYLSNGRITLNNIASGADDAIEKCGSLSDKSILIVDEGSLVFASRDSMKKEQRKLMKVINVIGQKNMIFIIILPSFFELNKIIAIQRSRFLLHVYTDKKLTRGRFCYFGERKKKILYEYGRKNYGSYGYPKANFRGLFKDFNPFGEEYLKVKKQSLIKALKTDETSIIRFEYEMKFRFYKKWLEFKKKHNIKILQPEEAELFEATSRRIQEYARKIREGSFSTLSQE
jgi:hypothetical protein